MTLATQALRTWREGMLSVGMTWENPKLLHL